MCKYFQVFLYVISLFSDDSFFIISHYYFYKPKHNSISNQQ